MLLQTVKIISMELICIKIAKFLVGFTAQKNIGPSITNVMLFLKMYKHTISKNIKGIGI